LQHFGHIFNAHAQTAENSDAGVRFLDAYFLMETDISAIWRRFLLIFALHWISWMSAILLLPV